MGLLGVMAAPDVAHIKALKGQAVSVAGLAFVLREFLAGNGRREGLRAHARSAFTVTCALTKRR